MIKKLLSLTLVLSGISAFSQSFTAVYPFTSVASGTASTGTTDPTTPPSATGVTFGSFMAVGTGTAPSAGGVFAFSGWPTGATNGNDATFTGSLTPSVYYDVTITPGVNYNVSLTSITFNINRSSTGPRNWAWRSNKDGFTTNLPASVTNTNTSVQTGDNFFWNLDAYSSSPQVRGNTVTLSGANFTNQTSAYEFRMYAWNAEGAAGTFRIDTVIFTGSASMTTGVGSVAFDLNSGLNVYPVPNHDGIVYIDNNTSDLSKVEVFDVLGNLLITQDTKGDNSKKLKLNLSDMPAGNYYIRFTADSKTATKKIVILK